MKANLAALLAMRGEFEAGRQLYADAQAMLSELGSTVVGASTSLATALVELLAGDLGAAERELTRDYQALTELGEKYLLSTVAGELARVFYAEGRFEEAEQMSHQAQDLADPDDIESQIRWRTVHARLLARNGKGNVALTSSGSGRAPRAHRRRRRPGRHARRPSRRPATLRARQDADQALDDALALYEAKENAVAAEALRVPATSA